MKRGLHNLPAPRRGHRRLGLLGLGLLVAISMVWQQNATVASFSDAEFSKATFTAGGKLPLITPGSDRKAGSIEISWDKAVRSGGEYWDTPEYHLSSSPSKTGTYTSLYSGPANKYTDATGTGKVGEQSLNFTAVAAGATHACGIARGQVYCWGSSPYALGLGSGEQKATKPRPVTGVGLAGEAATAITAGSDFTCAVAAGKAYCWGDGADGRLGNRATTNHAVPQAVSDLTGVTSIAAGASHACAIAGAKLYCWGDGADGRLGNGVDNNTRAVPTIVAAKGVLLNLTIAAVSAGESHSCAVADGKAYCWGSNSNGRLGDGTGTSQNTPVAVSTDGVLMGRAVSAIAAGGSHTCALADGKAFCWGLGNNGQLGDSNRGTSPVPVGADSGATYTAITSGAANSCAVAGGAIHCWGANVADHPIPFGGSTATRKVRTMSIGTNFGCVVVAEGPAECVGDGRSYQLGYGKSEISMKLVDVDLSAPACPDMSVRTSVASCSLEQGTDYYYKLDYSVGTWGSLESDPQLAKTKTRDALLPTVSNQKATSISVAWGEVEEHGLGYPEYTVERSLAGDEIHAVTLTTTGSRSWVDTGGLPPTGTFGQVSTGGGHSCGIVAGDVYCWGLNTSGQLGLGDTTFRARPTKVSGALGTKFTAVSAGANHTCAISDTATYCWGLNNVGQLGLGDKLIESSFLTPQKLKAVYTAISAGANHTCGISSTSVYCWGANASGQLGDGTTGSGPHFSPIMVVDASATPPLKVRFTNKDVKSVAAGGAHSCAVVSGAAWCWGSASDGQLGNGSIKRDSPTADLVQTEKHEQLDGADVIAAGKAHTCLITIASDAYCWGDDTNGQVGNNDDRTNMPYAQAVRGLSSVSRLSAGGNSTCAVAGSKTYCWGANANGQLGLGASVTNDQSLPAQVIANGALASAAATDVAAGGSHSCMVADGQAFCWGSGGDGQLGDGTTGNSRYARAIVGDARCASGAVALGDGTCSLIPGTSYKYRITYTLDGRIRTVGDWE